MRYRGSILLVLILSCVIGSGCGLLDLFQGKKDDDDSSSTPTSPSSPTISLDEVAGTWTSASASAPATGCGNVTYTVTPVSASSANVTFAGTCASDISVNGTGTGTLEGAALAWSVQGQVSKGGLTCPFEIPTGRATPQEGHMSIAYAGTVCGIPVSGTEVVQK